MTGFNSTRISITRYQCFWLTPFKHLQSRDLVFIFDLQPFRYRLFIALGNVKEKREEQSLSMCVRVGRFGQSTNATIH